MRHLIKSKFSFPFPTELSSALDKAAKITLAIYIFPLTFIAFLQTLASEVAISYIYLPIGVFIFALHLHFASGKYFFNILDMYNDPRTFRSVQRIIYYFTMSMALSIYIVSLVDPNIRSVIQELAYMFDETGEIMFFYTFLFVLAIVIEFLVKLIAYFNLDKFKWVGVVLVILIYFWGISLVQTANWTNNVGLILLGPINLLMANILFSKAKNDDENFIKW